MAQASALAEKMLPLGGRKKAMGEVSGAEAEAETNADDEERPAAGPPKTRRDWLRTVRGKAAALERHLAAS